MEDLVKSVGFLKESAGAAYKKDRAPIASVNLPDELDGLLFGGVVSKMRPVGGPVDPTADAMRLNNEDFLSLSCNACKSRQMMIPSAAEATTSNKEWRVAHPIVATRA